MATQSIPAEQQTSPSTFGELHDAVHEELRQVRAAYSVFFANFISADSDKVNDLTELSGENLFGLAEIVSNGLDRLDGIMERATSA